MSRLVNLKRNEHETWIIEATMKDAQAQVYDLTGASISWRIMDGSTILLDATITNGLIEIVDAEDGRADFTIALADHSSITPGTYQHECEVTLDGGEVTTQFHGRFTVEESLFA